MLLTIAAFVVALGLLVAVHEYGHYRVAVACGVKVLRFGVATLPLGSADPKASFSARLLHAISKPIYEWRPRRPRPGQDTVFAVGLFPVGGYVQMLGHGPNDVVPAGEEPMAFRNQRVRSRFAVVAAGPLANLLLAVALYAGVGWWGVDEPRAILATPVAGSLAADSGIRGLEEIGQAALDGDALEEVRSFETLRWMLTRGVLDGRNLRMVTRPTSQTPAVELRLPLASLPDRELNPALVQKIGIVGPWTPPVMGDIVPDSPAQRAGLRKGDVVHALGPVAIGDGEQLRREIAASIRDGVPLSQAWKIERNGAPLTIEVTPEVNREGPAPIARVGALIGAMPQMTQVRYGPLQGLWRGVVRTGEVSLLTVRLMGKIVTGQASLKNLSGPVTIAEYAGKSASLGVLQYLVFLALISISLGVINLMPVPVLDGGHLLYYVWEGMTGKRPSDAWSDWLQRGGLAIVVAMMAIALFNDLAPRVTRLFG